MPKCWIFQSNPNHYRILQAIADFNEETWPISPNKHRHEIQIGDLVFIWKTKGSSPIDDRGIYAVGRVDSIPEYKEPSPPFHYFTDSRKAKDLKKPAWRVDVRYLTKLLNAPILRPILEFNPRTSSVPILRFSRVTTYPVDSEACEELCRLAGIT